MTGQLCPANKRNKNDGSLARPPLKTTTFGVPAVIFCVSFFAGPLLHLTTQKGQEFWNINTYPKNPSLSMQSQQSLKTQQHAGVVLRLRPLVLPK
jgi:hypothetical protein